MAAYSASCVGATRLRSTALRLVLGDRRQGRRRKDVAAASPGSSRGPPPRPRRWPHRDQASIQKRRYAADGARGAASMRPPLSKPQEGTSPAVGGAARSWLVAPT